MSAPDFSATDVNGKAFKLSDFQGKVVILDFWATWCGPCRKGFPTFVELYNEHKAEGLEVIGIALERAADPAPVKKFMADNKVEFTIAIDDKRQITPLYKDVPGTNGIRSIPTTVIIDRSGKVHKAMVGGHSKADFEAMLKPLLEEKAKK